MKWSHGFILGTEVGQRPYLTLLYVATLNINFPALSLDLLLYSLTLPSAPLPLSLSTNCLKLLSSLLARQFRPRPSVGPIKRRSMDDLTFDPTHDANTKALVYLLDESNQNNEVRNPYCILISHSSL